MEFVKLEECEAGGVMYDSVFVIVDRLTGYVMGIPCRDEGLTAEKAAGLFLDRCVHFVGLPHEIMSDNNKLILKSFFQTLCRMSGIEQHKGVVKRPQSNGRAEAAVSAVAKSLRRFLDQRSKKWVHSLPLALWGLNDLPGVVAPYSPHRLVFGRDPVGFGDCPPLDLMERNEDAVQLFDRVSHETRFVQDKLTKIHAAERRAWLKKHPPQEFFPGQKVWVRKLPGGSKLDRLWFGPCEVMAVLSEACIEVDTGPAGLQILPSTRLKPYMASFGGKEIACHYFEPEGSGPPEEKEYVVEEVLDVRKNGPPHKWKWHVKFRGYPEPEWHDISCFVHHVNDVWHKFNKSKGIELSIADIMQAQK